MKIRVGATINASPAIHYAGASFLSGLLMCDSISNFRSDSTEMMPFINKPDSSGTQ